MLLPAQFELELGLVLGSGIHARVYAAILCGVFSQRRELIEHLFIDHHAVAPGSVGSAACMQRRQLRQVTLTQKLHAAKAEFSLTGRTGLHA